MKITKLTEYVGIGKLIKILKPHIQDFNFDGGVLYISHQNKNHQIVNALIKSWEAKNDN